VKTIISSANLNRWKALFNVQINALEAAFLEPLDAADFGGIFDSFKFCWPLVTTNFYIALDLPNGRFGRKSATVPPPSR
jgi:hypothetical protein